MPTIQASAFEARHPTLIRQLIIAAAFATYLFDPDDVVWHFIKQDPARTALEHAFFLGATLLIGVGAALCTRRAAIQPQQSAPHAEYLGELLFDSGIATLAPLSGAILLVAGECLRIYRLFLRRNNASSPSPPNPPPIAPRSQWSLAFRREAGKWGLFVTMILFTITLIDRLAEILAIVSVGTWALLNLPFRTRRPE